MSEPLEVAVRSIPTPHAMVSVTISSSSSDPGGSLTLLLLHGNSSCSKVFRHILSTPPPEVGRVVAMDYPGHGLSHDAAGDPEIAYTQRGYAGCAVVVLEALEVTDVVVLGWSLGGHVAIEMIPLLAEHRGERQQKLPRCRGIMITGTPAVNGIDQVLHGFYVAGASKAPEADRTPAAKDADGGGKGPDVSDPEHMNLAGSETWPDEEYERFPFQGHGPPHEQWQVDMARRTDGRARRIMFASLSEGRGVDQRGVLESSDVPCAVVNGADEPFINLDYVDAVKYKNLWEGKCHRIAGLGHTPFWERPLVFQEYLWRFIQDCAKSD